MKFRFLILVFFINTTIPVYSQPAKFTAVDRADEHFEHKNYLSAIPLYRSELKTNPENFHAKYRLAVCFLNTRLNRHQSITLLEEVSRYPQAEAEVWLHLGRAYHYNSRVEEAITAFEKYATLKPNKADEVEHYLEQCENALRFMRKPSNVTFSNLGKEINSSEPDYFPFIDKDEMTLLFTSRRKANVGGKKIEIDGYRSSDIFQSSIVNGNWAPAKNVGKTINGTLDEQVVGLSANGLAMYIYMDHIDKYGDIYVSLRKDLKSDFSRAKRCDMIINAEVESSGCLSEDGTVMFFARRESLKDNSDLYMARKLPNGKWGIPQLLPDVINTSFNEDMPFLSYDGKTLYFASEGHDSMGGYDLFKCTWDQEVNTFSKPENLGYPINSTDDDRSICVTGDNRLAYVSAFRESGYGDLDIYRVTFNDVEPVNVIYTGKFILGPDSTGKDHKPPFEIKISVTNVDTKAEYLYMAHSKTGRYVMALPAGTYRLVTQAKGYARHKEEFIVSDLGQVNLERKKNFHLRKINKQ